MFATEKLRSIRDSEINKTRISPCGTENMLYISAPDPVFCISTPDPLFLQFCISAKPFDTDIGIHMYTCMQRETIFYIQN